MCLYLTDILTTNYKTFSSKNTFYLSIKTEFVSFFSLYILRTLVPLITYLRHTIIDIFLKCKQSTNLGTKIDVNAMYLLMK